MTIRSDSDNLQDVEHMPGGQQHLATADLDRNSESLSSKEDSSIEARNDDNESSAADDNNNNNSQDDDDVTVIVLEPGDDEGEMVGSGWIDQDSPEIQERRRNVLLRELQRVQRASFIHFMILCLIPTSLLFIVIATVLGEDENCESVATTCQKEPRTFINAFTTRCICDAIAVKRADP